MGWCLWSSLYLCRCGDGNSDKKCRSAGSRQNAENAKLPFPTEMMFSPGSDHDQGHVFYIPKNISTEPLREQLLADAGARRVLFVGFASCGNLALTSAQVSCRVSCAMAVLPLAFLSHAQTFFLCTSQFFERWPVLLSSSTLMCPPAVFRCPSLLMSTLFFSVGPKFWHSGLFCSPLPLLSVNLLYYVAHPCSCANIFALFIPIFGTVDCCYFQSDGRCWQHAAHFLVAAATVHPVRTRLHRGR
jgi:hypothetical protein